MPMHTLSPSPEDPEETPSKVTAMEAFVARARRERDRQATNRDPERPESWCDPDAEASTRLSESKHPVKAVIARKGGRDRSRAMFRLKLRQCCEFIQGAAPRSLSIDDALSYPWHHVDVDAAADYARFIYGRYSTVSTRNDYISVLRQLITACHRAGLISIARRDEVLEELPTVAPGPSARRRRLAMVEIEALLTACVSDPSDEGCRDAAVIALFATTGLRMCELVDIRICDWDRAEGTIVVRHTKNGHPHTLFVHPSTDAYLRRWLERRGSTNPQEALFSWPGGPRKGAPVCTDTARSWVKKRQIAAGIAPFGAHDFRRTFASILLRTHDLPTVGRLLNHRKPASTLIYDMASDDEQRSAVNTIELTAPTVDEADQRDQRSA